jgi:hypothetical protein
VNVLACRKLIESFYMAKATPTVSNAPTPVPADQAMPQKPKSSKSWLIIALVVIIVLLVCALVAILSPFIITGIYKYIFSQGQVITDDQGGKKDTGKDKDTNDGDTEKIQDSFLFF